MPSCTPRPRSRTPRPSKDTLQQLNQTCRRQRSVAPGSTRCTTRPARRITTFRPQSASMTSRRATRRTAREKSCLAPAADRRRSPTNATKARCVLDASKTAPLRKTSCQQDASPAPRRPRNEMPQHNTPTQHILLGRRDTSPTVESLQGPTRRLKTTNSPRPSEIPPGPRSHQRPPHTSFVAITPCCTSTTAL